MISKALRLAADYDGKGLSKLIIKWIFTYLTKTETNFKVIRSEYMNYNLDHSPFSQDPSLDLNTKYYRLK